MFKIETKPGIRDLTNDAWQTVMDESIDSAVDVAFDLVAEHGQETAQKVGQAVVVRLIGQTMTSAKESILAEYNRRFVEKLAGAES